MTWRRILRVGLGVLLGVYLLAGVGWTALNLGEVPHYGDTPTYFRLAEDLEVDQHRGIVYPWILAQAVRVLLHGEAPPGLGQNVEAQELPSRVCSAPPRLAWLQVLQIVVCALSLTFFLWAVRRDAGAGGRPGSGPGGGPEAHWETGGRRLAEDGLLVLLLLFDPLISHFNLSLMTDSLAFSGCLLFCGALMALADRRRSPWVLGVVLGAGFLLAAGLRVEKKWVLLATFLLTCAVWLWTSWRAGEVHRDARRALCVGVVVAGALALILQVERSSFRKSSELSSVEAFVHFRIGLSHLSELYDQLPERTRARLSREDAAQYDGGVNGVRRVFWRLNRRDEALRREFTEDVLRTVWPRRWPAILLDGGRQTLENTFSTLSVTAHVVAWHVGGQRAVRRWFPATGNVWNYQRMVFHHPVGSFVVLGLWALVLVLAVPLALRRWRRPSPAELCRWTPCWGFVLVNAAFFAAAFHYLNFRYVIFAHACFLLLVLRPVVREVLGTDVVQPSRR